MKLSLKAGTTSKLINVFINDSTSTIGAGLTGLVYNSASLTAYYYREGAASAVAITLATMVLGTWASGGFVVVDGTNMPGVYQLGVPDAAFAAGAKSVIIFLKGAANMAPLVLEIELTAVDNQSATGFVTSVPSVVGAVGSVTGLTVANLDAAVSSRMATYTQPSGFLAATFPSVVASTTNISAGTITTVTNLTNAPTAGDLTATMKTSVANAVWNEATSGHVTAGTTGAAIIAAGSAGDPWSTSLPGAYGAGTAGNIIPAIMTRLGAPAGASIAADIANKTGYTLTSAYDFAKGTSAMAESYAANGVAPTPIQAIYAVHQMLMQFGITGTAYTVKKLDNTTPAFVGTLNAATGATSIVRT